MRRGCAGLLLACWAAATLACASTPEDRVLSADEQYALALREFEERDYSEAIEALQTFTFNYPQDPRIVDARWLTAEAYYRSEDWATAAQEHLNFQRDYPREERADDAVYQAGRAYQQMSLRPELDQTETHRAINVYERVLTEYPASEFADEARQRRQQLRDKLAEKLYLNAEFYHDDEDYRAAEIYLNDLIESHPDSQWLAPAYALLVLNHCARGMADEASRVYSRLGELFPDSAAIREVAAEVPESCRRGAAPPAASTDGSSESR